jgi:hypothetical protein
MITAYLDKSIFNGSKNKKLGTAKKAAKHKAGNDLVMTFKEDTEVNKKRLTIDDEHLALDTKKHDTINRAVQSDIISTFINDGKMQLETIMTLKKRKQHLGSVEAHEEGASQDSAFSLFDVYLQEQANLRDGKKLMKRNMTNLCRDDKRVLGAICFVFVACLAAFQSALRDAFVLMESHPRHCRLCQGVELCNSQVRARDVALNTNILNITYLATVKPGSRRKMRLLSQVWRCLLPATAKMMVGVTKMTSAARQLLRKPCCNHFKKTDRNSRRYR